MTEKDFTGKTIAFSTLGCKLNFSETSAMSRKFEAMGFERVDFKDTADVYVLNSCSVTAESDKKSRNLIRSALKRNPSAVMMVTGCYAQLKSDEIAKIEGVDFILGSAEKYHITGFLHSTEKNREPLIKITDHKRIKDYFSAYSFGDRTRTFLKVQDGCNYFCTYCTIPMARGRSRNDLVENIVTEAKEIAGKGIKEVILTGVNIGDFGHTTGETFLQLIESLDRVEGIERFRISSIEPNLLSDEVIDFVARSQRFAPHFHIPLQSGSNEVLGLMKRKYKREIFAGRVQKIKEVLPDAFIGVDVIAGTNGETEAFFNDSFQFIRHLDISQLHAFPYSERPGTEALTIEPKVAVPERKKRVQALIALSESKHHDFYKSQLGKTHKVLFETKSDGLYWGWTENYVRVAVRANENIINQVKEVLLKEIQADGTIRGNIIEA